MKTWKCITRQWVPLKAHCPLVLWSILMKLFATWNIEIILKTYNWRYLKNIHLLLWNKQTKTGKNQVTLHNAPKWSFLAYKLALCEISLVIWIKKCLALLDQYSSPQNNINNLLLDENWTSCMPITEKMNFGHPDPS